MNSKIKEGLIDFDNTKFSWKNYAQFKILDSLIFVKDNELILDGKLDILIKDECVKKIIVMVKQQKAYIKEIDNVATPLDRAESTNIKGKKLREMHRFV